MSNTKLELSMPVRVSGFAKGLVRCLDFETVSVEELDQVLVGAAETLELDYIEPSSDSPFIRSGAPFAELVFVQHGTAVPWQSPHSELAAPFLIGVHEFLMDAERWVASYSAITEAVVVRIPKVVMARVVDELPSVRERMHELVMRRLARYYWVSLATSGAPGSRVAAALVSRLALEDRDYGVDRVLAVRQTDIARLTTMSRSGVSVGLAELARERVVQWGDRPGARFRGEVLVPDVDLLKDYAFLDMRTREIRPLLAVDRNE
ncbi:MAG: helix-turn-helix domain-containing protein [Acidobacteria bacterium]|nr:helix-turn-helix domain-containing protein [Acidobacteriota bacterium]